MDLGPDLPKNPEYDSLKLDDKNQETIYGGCEIIDWGTFGSPLWQKEENSVVVKTKICKIYVFNLST